MGLKGGLVKKSLAVALAAVSKGHTSKRAVFGGKKFRLWEATKWLSFGIFELKFGMDPWFYPYFWLLEKKIGAGLLLLNKPVPTCQIFEAKVIGLAIHEIQNFSQNLMGRWVMSVQYEFDQFRKWNFWNGGQKTEKALKNAIVLTLIIKFFFLLHKMACKPQKRIPHPWKCALRPQNHLDGSKKAEFGVPSQIQIFSKSDVFTFLAFFYQFWLWSTVESTWMVNLTSYVSSGIHINAKQTPGAPLGGPTRLDFPRFWLIFRPFLTRVTWSTYYMYHNTTDMSCEAPGAHPPSPHFPCSTPLPLSQKVDFSVHVQFAKPSMPTTTSYKRLW